MPGLSQGLPRGHLFLIPLQWIISFNSKVVKLRLREVEEFVHSHTETKTLVILPEAESRRVSSIFCPGVTGRRWLNIS